MLCRGFRLPVSNLLVAVTGLGLLIAAGCQQSTAPGSSTNSVDSASGSASSTDAVATAQAGGANAGQPATPARSYAPVQLGGATAMAGNGGVVAADKNSESVLEELQPLQVLLGKWSGNARKAAQLHEIEWVWDFQSNPEQPALVMSSEKSSYIKEGRLTYYPAQQEFEFQMTTPEDEQRTLRGKFSQPVEDVAGEDKKLQRTFKLELQEPPREDSREQWQMALHQLENNRFLVELDRRRGSGSFQRVDTVHSQREGTSFALSDSDYGDKTCIISQGLGTISVSFKGRSFWVCCTGCQAAFNDDPEKWIAKWEAKQKEMTQ